jgi:hypothetical protein
LRHLGHGRYSDVFEILDLPTKVLRLSYYDEGLLREVFKRLMAAEKMTKEKAPDAVKRSHELLNIDPIRVENNMVQITNALIQKRVCPHYVRVYDSKDCLDFFKHVQKRIPDVRVHELQRHNTPLQRRYNHIKIMDRYSSNLTDFLKPRNGPSVLRDDVLAVIIFQVIYSTFALQTYVDAFRHNDLSINNVLIELDKAKFRSTKTPTQYIEYTVQTQYGEPKFCVPDLGINVAIGDFDFVSGGKVRIPGLGHISLKNQKVAIGGNFNKTPWHINPTKNESYDPQYFLTTLYRVISQMYPSASQLPKTKEFLKRVLASTSSINRGKDPIKSLFPTMLLLDMYFGHFQKKIKNIKVSARYDLHAAFLEEGEVI